VKSKRKWEMGIKVAGCARDARSFFARRVAVSPSRVGVARKTCHFCLYGGGRRRHDEAEVDLHVDLVGQYDHSLHLNINTIPL